MKKLLLLSVSLLIAAVSFSQKIKVTVTEAQIFGKFGKHDYNKVINSPTEDRGKKTIDCDYVFDLQEKTLTFVSRSTQGVDNKLLIETITKKGSVYIFEWPDYGLYDSSYSYPVKVFLDTENNIMFYTWYDQYGDRSFVQKDHEIKITISGAQ